ncbi:MAG: hypothetical protein OEV30_10765 [Ignavibacteria bacterium]|nr:hypothetical protein [Ignavibacteria bacterium]
MNGEQRLGTFVKRGMIAGISALAILMAGGVVYRQQFFESYLFGFIFWVGLSLGCLGILLLHHLVSGAWGHIIQRMTEAGGRILPYVFLMFAPVVIGMEFLYPWTDQETMASSHILHHKEWFLTTRFFLVRSVIYFGAWIFFAYWLSSRSRRQDKTGEAGLTRRMKLFSGPAIVAFVISVTLASVDWMMSLEPEWYSTMYGMHIIVGMILTALAFCIVLLRMFSLQEPYASVLTTRHYHHIGNMLFAFTILWAYMAFSQFLIIWSGNLPEDNFWYIRRLGTGWNIIAVFLLVGHFFVPFVLLLFRNRKRYIDSLARVAILILIMRFVDYFWLLKPAFSPEGWTVHWMDILAPIAIGGIWLALFFREFRSQPMIPLKDPRFSKEAFHVHDLE